MVDINTWYFGRAGSPSKEDTPPSSVKPTSEIIKTIVAMRKAMADKDWDEITSATDMDGPSTTDITYHSVNSDTHKDYDKLFHGPDTHHDESRDHASGVSSKVTHTFGDNTFMTKPYFSLESHDKRAIPLSGWSIMTNKNLYDAGNLSHLVEDVGMKEMTGKDDTFSTPVTVHKFAKNFKIGRELPEGVNPNAGGTARRDMSADDGTVDPDATVINSADTERKRTAGLKEKHKNINNINKLHARQIGVMDYLTGNFDRHLDNLMVENPSPSGKPRSLLAIDHDRSFNYGQAGGNPNMLYFDNAMHRLGDDAAVLDTEHDRDLSEWWSQNKSAIYDEMNRNLNSLTDSHMRKYVRKNFDQRFQHIAEWAETFDDHKRSFFAPDPSNELPKGQEFGMDHDREEYRQKVKKELPDDNFEAFNMASSGIRDIFKQNLKSSPKDTVDEKMAKEDLRQRAKALKHLAYEIGLNSTAEEAVKILGKTSEDEIYNDIKHEVLMDLKTRPEVNAVKIREILKSNDNLPDDTKFINIFWENHLKDILADMESRQGIA